MTWLSCSSLESSILLDSGGIGKQLFLDDLANPVDYHLGVASTSVCIALSFTLLQFPGLQERRSARLEPRDPLRQRREMADHRRPLVAVALAVAAGVLLDRYFSLGLGWLAISGSLCGAWLPLSRRGNVPSSAIVLLLFVASAAAGWHHQQWRLFADDDLGRFATVSGEPVCLEVELLGGPRMRPAPMPSPLRAIPQGVRTSLSCRVVGLRDGEVWRSASGRTELVVDGEFEGRLEQLGPGDRIRVFAQMRAPAQAMNPGEFDYADDARIERKLAMLRTESPDCVSLVEVGSPSLQRFLSRARQAIANRLVQDLGPQRGALAAAMLVGAREGVAREVTEAFRRTGSLHVLVVSGLHVGIVVGLFYVATRMGWFPRRRTLLLMMVLIFAYTLLAGARPPVVRAAVLAEVLCLAAILGRPLLAINSLALAAVVVIAINPAELFQTGTQLSFLAAATLIWFGRRQSVSLRLDPMQRLLRSVESMPKRAARGIATWAGTILLATLAVWIVAAPLLLSQFHLLSPVALPISLLVFPLVTFSLVSALALVSLGIVFPPLHGLLSVCCDGALLGLEQSIAWADVVPAGSFYHAGPATWWCIGAYVLMLLGFLLGHRPAARGRLTRVGLAWIATGFLAAVATDQRPDGLRCSFISAGHGLSVLVETPTGETVLYDAGSLGSPEAAADTISSLLWSRGISRLDAVVLSHTDIDHYNAVPELTERFSIGGVYTTHMMFERERLGVNSAAWLLADALAAKDIDITMIEQGDRLRLGEVWLEALHPTANGTGGSDNSNSLVVGIEYEGRRVLLPGDLESPGLEELLVQAPYDCDLLLAPHHGSSRSDPPGLAAWCQPEWVVISSGIRADTTEAGESYAAGRATVLRTAEQGMIEATLGSTQVRLETYLHSD